MFLIIWILTIKLSRKQIIFLIILINVLALLIKFYLVKSFNNLPVADAYYIFDGTDVLHFTDNPAYLEKGMYFGTYPEQLGMVSILYPLAALFRFNMNGYYLTFAVISQVTIMLLTYVSYRVSNIKSALWASLLFNIFLPNISVVFLIYGDLFSFFFLSLALAIHVHFNQKKLNYIAFLMIAVLIAFAYLARLSTNIFIIATIITVILAYRDKIAKIVVTLCLASVLLFTYSINEYFYNTEKISLGTYAQPFNTWIRLGTGVSGYDQTTPGFHNNQVEVDFADLKYNKEKMYQLNSNIIHEQIDDLIKNKTIYEFLIEKLKVTWTDPDFEMTTLILPYVGHPIEDPLTESINNPKGSGAFELAPNNAFGEFLVAHYYDFRKFEKIIYFGILLGLLVTFFKKSRNHYDVFAYLITIGFVLLHLMIEIKSRYVYVYINFMILYVSINMPFILDKLYSFLRMRINNVKGN